MDVDAQTERWENIAAHIKGGAPRLEHTAHDPGRAIKLGAHGYIVTARVEDHNARSGKSRQVVFGPHDVNLEDFLDMLEEAYLTQPSSPVTPSRG